MDEGVFLARGVTPGREDGRECSALHAVGTVAVRIVVVRIPQCAWTVYNMVMLALRESIVGAGERGIWAMDARGTRMDVKSDE